MMSPSVTPSASVPNPSLVWVPVPETSDPGEPQAAIVARASIVAIRVEQARVMASPVGERSGTRPGPAGRRRPAPPTPPPPPPPPGPRPRPPSSTGARSAAPADRPGWQITLQDEFERAQVDK